ncbi:hypothetical protein CLOM_g23558 [Closterium sp. NIES-68]|nr:hypothetical protein CLOM_g14745 [Closterium sp. NIES-68]GJP39165.1 hypothetical protein CLOM_g23558 [Closterium sp. NIES-68]GJP57427.1 hypothetical protein CLOP_g27 [Closterium sp. NIES-67]
MFPFALARSLAPCHACAAVCHAARLAVSCAVDYGSVVTSASSCSSSRSTSASSCSSSRSTSASTSGTSNRTGSGSNSNRYSSNSAGRRSSSGSSSSKSSRSSSSKGGRSSTGKKSRQAERLEPAADVTSSRSTSPSTDATSLPPQSVPSSPSRSAFPLFSSPLPAVLPPPPALSQLPPRQQERLSLYLDLLLEWNQRTNLTAVTSRSEAEQRHLADSLSLIPVFSAIAAPPAAVPPAVPPAMPPAVPPATTPTATAPVLEAPQNAAAAQAPPAVLPGVLRLVDVGTGAGLPGIVLAVARPSWHVTLVESLNKRCDFLLHVVGELGLRNVQVVWGRAEEVGRDPIHREAFDVAVARAVAEMRVLNELCLPLVRVGGAFIAAKGPNPQEEIEAATNSASLLGAQLARVYEVASSSTNGQRTAVIYQRVLPTPSKYPRRPGMPSKRPL